MDLTKEDLQLIYLLLHKVPISYTITTETEHEVLNLINKIYKEKELTIVFVTHNMDYVLEYATNIVIVKNGVIAFETKNKQKFLEIIKNKNYNLVVPELIKFQELLENNGVKLSKIHYNYNDFLEDIKLMIGDSYE